MIFEGNAQMSHVIFSSSSFVNYISSRFCDFEG